MEVLQLFYALWLLGCTLLYTKTTAQTECTEPSDVAILLDASGSIGRRKWPKVVAFTKSLVNAFKVSEEGTHIGIVMYATKTKVQVSFNTFTGAARTPENINKVMDDVDYNKWKGLTYIDRGLDIANRELFTEANGMRPDKKKILILFTDGKQTKNREPYTELDLAAQPIKDKGIEIHAIGIGKPTAIDKPDLERMASKPEFVYTAESFEELIPMALRIMQKSCDIPIQETSVS